MSQSSFIFHWISPNIYRELTVHLCTYLQEIYNRPLQIPVLQLHLATLQFLLNKKPSCKQWKKGAVLWIVSLLPALLTIIFISVWASCFWWRWQNFETLSTSKLNNWQNSEEKLRQRHWQVEACFYHFLWATWCSSLASSFTLQPTVHVFCCVCGSFICLFCYLKCVFFMVCDFYQHRKACSFFTFIVALLFLASLCVAF